MSFHRRSVKGVGGTGQELPVLQCGRWAKVKVFKLTFEALLLREASNDKGWYCAGDA